MITSFLSKLINNLFSLLYVLTYFASFLDFIYSDFGFYSIVEYLFSAQNVVHTTPRTHFLSGVKSRVSKSTFLIKSDGVKWSRIFFFFWSSASPIRVAAVQKGWIGLASWQVSLKGLAEFQNKEFQTTFHHHFYFKNVNVKTRDFGPLIEWVLASVCTDLSLCTVLLIQNLFQILGLQFWIFKRF